MVEHGFLAFAYSVACVPESDCEPDEDECEEAEEDGPFGYVGVLAGLLGLS
jgi:hypothetical protein